MTDLSETCICSHPTDWHEWSIYTLYWGCAGSPLRKDPRDNNDWCPCQEYSESGEPVSWTEFFKND